MTILYEVLPDVGALAEHVARRLEAAARTAVAERGRFAIALSGGTTPLPLYRLLATPEWRHRLPWSQTHVFWSDERWVPHDHPESNYGTARAALLEHVPVPAQQVHPVRTDGAPTDSAAAYSRAVSETTSDNALDMVLLGVGNDGHTASLFPGSDAVYVQRRGAVACHVQALDAWRVTLTLAEIDAARAVTLLVAGVDKAAAVADVRTGRSALPAGRVRPTSGNVVWATDLATAAAVRTLSNMAGHESDERAKSFAGTHAAELVADGMVVGLGTGSTARHFVAALGRRLRERRVRDVIGLPTSQATERQARSEGIPLVAPDDGPSPDLTIDGADEVSPSLDLIKGMGGALVREKIVATASQRLVVVSDHAKLVDRLGTRSPLPVAIVPFGWQGHADALRRLGADAVLRVDATGVPYVTDDGLYILDARFPSGIDDAPAVQETMARRPGVVTTGLFLQMAHEAIVGDALGTWVHLPRP